MIEAKGAVLSLCDLTGNMGKTCRTCRIAKSPDDFSWKVRSSGLRQAHCRECMRVAGRRYHAAHPEVNRRWKIANKSKMQDFQRSRDLRSKYGISVQQYQSMLDAQFGLCAICGSASSRSIRSPNLHVDHNHETGAVRGLLCHPCNLGIGYLSDSAETIKRALDYIQKCDCV